jgi:hypothetical protein
MDEPTFRRSLGRMSSYVMKFLEVGKTDWTASFLCLNPAAFFCGFWDFQRVRMWPASLDQGTKDGDNLTRRCSGRRESASVSIESSRPAATELCVTSSPLIMNRRVMSDRTHWKVLAMAAMFGLAAMGGFAQSQLRPLELPNFYDIRRSGTSVVIFWGAGSLQAAASLKGPWSDVPNARSPYTNSVAGKKGEFYRLTFP